MPLVEIFKPIIIDGKETEYLISDHGNCVNKHTGELKSKSYDKKGRAYLSIYGKYMPVARYMAIAFLKAPGNNVSNYEVDHIDENRTNDILDNLQWMTPKENIQKHYKVKMDIHLGENNPFSVLTGNDVDNIFNLALEFDLRPKEIADKYGVEKSTIAKILRGEHWPHYYSKYDMSKYKPKFGPRSLLDTDTKNKIYELRQLGLKFKDIKNKLNLNLSISGITKIYNQLNIEKTEGSTTIENDDMYDDSKYYVIDIH